MKIIKHREDPLSLRGMAYDAENSMREFADAYYWERRGDPKPMEVWLSKRDAIKARFPKKPSP